MLAFSLGTDAVHSPNENFPVSRFALATRVYVRTLYAAAEEDERASKGRKSEKGADRRVGEL